MTTTEPGPILRAMIQAAGHEVDPVDEAVNQYLDDERDIAYPVSVAEVEMMMSDGLAKSVQRELALSSPVFALLKQQLGIERKQHVEDVARRKLTMWWESIWFALLRALAKWATKRIAKVDRAAWWGTLDELEAAVHLYPPDTVPVTIFDETEAEYVDRLKKLVLERATGGIPVHVSRNVPPDTAHVFDPKALEFDPMQASPITFEHDDTPFVQSDAFQSAMRDIRSAVAGGPFPARPHDQLLQPTSYAGIRVDADEEPHAAP